MVSAPEEYHAEPPGSATSRGKKHSLPDNIEDDGSIAEGGEDLDDEMERP